MYKYLILAAGANALTDKQKKAEQIALGVLEGAVGKEFPDLTTCITNADTIVDDFIKAYGLFKQKTISGAVDGLKIIGGDVKNFKGYLA